MTPVEERIDHEEVKISLEEARKACDLDFGYWPTLVQQVIRALDTEIERLLTEHSARESEEGKK